MSIFLASCKITIPVMKDKTPFLFVGSIYHPDVTIAPMKGRVLKEPKTVKISYTPKAYVTLSYPVHLYIPTLSALPLFFTITADTKPGKLSEMISSMEEKKKTEFRRKLPFIRNVQYNLEPSKPAEESGWSQHKTNLFLLKKDEDKEPEFELIGPFGRKISEEEAIKKLKQSNFLKEVFQLRKTCLEPLNHRRTVLNQLKLEESNDWDLIWLDYENEIQKSKNIEEYRTRPLFLRQRIINDNTTENEFSFTSVKPNLWFVRRQTLNRFIEAVRRVILKNRLLKILNLLKESLHIKTLVTKGIK